MARKKGDPYRLEYTEEMGDRICEIVATTAAGISTICEMHPEIPSYETIRLWRYRHPSFSAKFNEAKAKQSELLAESLEDVIKDVNQHHFIDEKGARRVDTGILNQARLLCDTRKWIATKLAPKIYGDTKYVDDLRHDNYKLKQELAELRKRLDKENESEY